MGYSFQLTARVLLYAPSHRQDSTYHSLCYTSHGALAGPRNSSMGPPHEGSIRRPIAPWANALTTELHLAPPMNMKANNMAILWPWIWTVPVWWYLLWSLVIVEWWHPNYSAMTLLEIPTWSMPKIHIPQLSTLLSLVQHSFKHYFINEIGFSETVF